MQAEFTAEARRRSWRYWELALLILMTSAIRGHRLHLPLERDEGEYAYIGQLILDGVPPYQQAYTMKLPGIHLLYAGMLATFGQTVAAVRFGLILVTAASTVVLFLVGRRLLDDASALAGAAVWGCFSLHPAVTGQFANAEHFVVLPMLTGTLLLLQSATAYCLWRLALAGLMMGIAFVIKQHGAVFIVFGAVLATFLPVGSNTTRRRQAMRLQVFGLAAALPFGLICLWMWMTGVFSQFWFWTFTYTFVYGSQTTWATGWIYLQYQLHSMTQEWLGFGLLAIIGFMKVARRDRSLRLWVVWFPWIVASLTSLSMGRLFRDHYFLLALPVASLLAGAALMAATPPMRWILLLILGSTITWTVNRQWDLWVRGSDAQVVRAVFGVNPFAEAPAIADYLSRRTDPSDPIAILGSEPEIFFLARRRSATPYIYMYPLMEEHPLALRMQQTMQREIANKTPKFIVVVPFIKSWAPRPGSTTQVRDWSHAFLRNHYKLVGVIDFATEHPHYWWDADVQSRPQNLDQQTLVSVYYRLND